MDSLWRDTELLSAPLYIYIKCRDPPTGTSLETWQMITKIAPYSTYTPWSIAHTMTVCKVPEMFLTHQILAQISQASTEQNTQSKNITVRQNPSTCIEHFDFQVSCYTYHSKQDFAIAPIFPTFIPLPAPGFYY